MRFLYPLGLLGLIGVPILIIIYIIKNKFTEQTVSSTYLWTLSEKFLKRKKKLPKIAGIISLLLQIAAVIAISLTIAHPILVFPNAAAEYCFILDGSGSMNIESEGKSRFVRGKEEILAIVSDSAYGSVYTLVYVGADTTITLCEQVEEKDVVYNALKDLQPSYGVADASVAMEIAQTRFVNNPTLSTYFVTDKDYDRHDNVEVINLANGETNYAVVSVDYDYEEGEEGALGELSVFASVLSYKGGADLEVQLFVDGGEQPVKTSVVSVLEGESLSVEFHLEKESFNSVKVVVNNDDGFALDNECVVYNVKSENEYKTLLVSETPFFFKSVIQAVSNADVEVLSAKEYEKAEIAHGGVMSGFGLYIYDSITPSALPSDGSVWLINQSGNIPETEFSVRTEVVLEEAVLLEMTKSSSTLAKKLTNGLKGTDLYVYKYMKYGLYGDFTTLYSYEGQPMIFTGENAYGNREVVFAFSLHDSNFALSADFVLLARNLLSFSFPNVVEKVNYDCGERLELNVPPAAEAITITSPSGEMDYPASNVMANEYVFEEIGTYTVTITIGGEDRDYHVFVSVPQSERKVSVLEGDFSLQGEVQEGGLDGKYDDLLAIFLLLAVVFLVDWGVYCYDKYQLR